MWPAAIITGLVARAGFADLVQGVTQSAAIITFAVPSTVQPARPPRNKSAPASRFAFAQSGRIPVDVNMLLYAFGLPLYAALVLAAREPKWPRRLILGYAVLMPFVAWGVLADFLKNVAITAGPLVASQTGFLPWQREFIAFAYQFGTLILPTVVPAVVWVLTHRAFLERLRGNAS